MRAKAGQVGRLVADVATGPVEKNGRNGTTVTVRSNRLLMPPYEPSEQDEPEAEDTSAPFAKSRDLLKPHLRDIAKRAKKRAKQAKQDPEWPNVDLDTVEPPPAEPEWPNVDQDTPPPTSNHRRARHQEQRTERDHDPPPPRREKSRVTSTNGGKPMSVSPMKYNDLVTNASSRREGWQEAADAFRRDANEFDEKAKDHDEAARIFKSTGNYAAAEEREEAARQLRDDANSCRTYASKMQERANGEVSAA